MSIIIIIIICTYHPYFSTSYSVAPTALITAYASCFFPSPQPVYHMCTKQRTGRQQNQNATANHLLGTEPQRRSFLVHTSTLHSAFDATARHSTRSSFFYCPARCGLLIYYSSHSLQTTPHVVTTARPFVPSPLDTPHDTRQRPTTHRDHLAHCEDPPSSHTPRCTAPDISNWDLN